ncbi:hypothetical protein HDV00_005724 [Rhizophlyctis rosea]|nr:hypothetical protein HDV00_005724 [Rhizophlyctis rosea]
MANAPPFATPDLLLRSVGKSAPDADHADLVANIISPPLPKRRSTGVHARFMGHSPRSSRGGSDSDFGVLGAKAVDRTTGFASPPVTSWDNAYSAYDESTTRQRRYMDSDEEYRDDEGDEFDTRDFDTATDATPDLVSGGAGSVMSDESAAVFSGRRARASSFEGGRSDGGGSARGSRVGSNRHGERIKSWNTDVQRGARESSLDQGHDIKDLVADLVALNHDLARANIRYGNLSSRAIELRHQLRRSMERLESMDETFASLLEDLRVLRFEQQFLSETLGLLSSRPTRRSIYQGQIQTPPTLLSESDAHALHRGEIIATIAEYRRALLDGEEALPTSTNPTSTTLSPTAASATTSLLSGGGPHATSPSDPLLRRARLSMLLHDSSLSLRDLLSQIGYLSPRVEAATDALDACVGFSAEYRRWIADAEVEKERLGSENSRMREERTHKVGKYSGVKKAGSSERLSGKRGKWGLAGSSEDDDDDEDEDINPLLMGGSPASRMGRGRRDRRGSTNAGYFDLAGPVDEMGAEDDEEVYYSCPETFDVDEETYFGFQPSGPPTNSGSGYVTGSGSYFTAICTPPASDRRSVSSGSSGGSDGGRGEVRGTGKGKGKGKEGSPVLRRRQTWSELVVLPGGGSPGKEDVPEPLPAFAPPEVVEREAGGEARSNSDPSPSLPTTTRPIARGGGPPPPPPPHPQTTKKPNPNPPLHIPSPPLHAFPLHIPTPAIIPNSSTHPPVFANKAVHVINPRTTVGNATECESFGVEGFSTDTEQFDDEFENCGYGVEEDGESAEDWKECQC